MKVLMEVLLETSSINGNFFQVYGEAKWFKQISITSL